MPKETKQANKASYENAGFEDESRIRRASEQEYGTQLIVLLSLFAKHKKYHTKELYVWSEWSNTKTGEVEKIKVIL